jgi:YVTN family beta-propeller protein
MHPDGGTVYVSLSNSNKVSVIDTNANTQTQLITGFWSPSGLAVHPNGDRLYVADTSADTVSIVDTISNTIVDTVPVGYFPVAFGDFITPGLIFADGFESGDLSAWSATVPP